MNPASTQSAVRRLSPHRELFLARIKEFWREPAAIFWVYGFPLIMIIALGIAFRSRPPERMPVGVLDSERAAAVSAPLERDERFEVLVQSEEEARVALRTGHIEMLVIPGAGEKAPPVYRYDPTRPGSVLARDAVDDVLQRDRGREDVFTAQHNETMEPGGRYIDFLVPGLIGMGLLGGGMWGVGFGLVDMRIRKLLKRFAATPMNRGHFLWSLMISRIVFTVPEVLIILFFARLFFGVQNYGSLGALSLLIVLGALQFSGIGLLVACRARKLETASGLMNLVMMPMWIGSGIFFSTERFPNSAQPFIQALPLTPLNNALRAVINEGATLATLGPELLIMTAWTVVTFILALKWFKWT